MEGTATSEPAAVALRPFPYPYRALFAFCSDLDETPDGSVFFETARFLNGTEMTAMGPGLGMEVANSIYFDMEPRQFSYWNASDAERAGVRALIRSGHVDCLHSFGDLARTRSQAARSLEELQRHHCRLEVWTDHAVAPTNLGTDIMHGSGDRPGSEAYHADLSCAFGIRYVWRGRVTSVIGQDVPRSLRGIFRLRHPVASGRTVGKELAKGVLARRGSAKYAMHGPNEILRRTELHGGQPVWEFLRSNPCYRAVDKGETAEGVGEVLEETLLERLVMRGGAMILYTHFGKVRDRQQPFGSVARRALGGLAAACREGRILVTTTRRLLGYGSARREASFGVHEEGGCLKIAVSYAGPIGTDVSRSDVAGFSFYVPDPQRTTLSLNGRTLETLRRNPPDHTGRPSVSIPWSWLEFPRL